MGLDDKYGEWTEGRVNAWREQMKTSYVNTDAVDALCDLALKGLAARSHELPITQAASESAGADAPRSQRGGGMAPEVASASGMESSREGERPSLPSSIVPPEPEFEGKTGYNAGAITKLQEELVGVVELERLNKSPQWYKSVVNDLIKRIYQHRVAASAIAAIPIDVLRGHYLSHITCDEETNTDNPVCSCSTVHLGWHPSIGAAVEAWIQHVSEMAATDGSTA